MVIIIILVTAALAIISVGQFLYLFWRLHHIKPAAIQFKDVESAQIWAVLRYQRPILVIVPSEKDALRHLGGNGDVWVRNGPRIFTVFHVDSMTHIPMIHLRRCGRGYVMGVRYARQLAPVMIAILNGLNPVCALSTTRAADRPIQRAKLLLSLDGNPWFVLQELARMRIRSRMHSSTKTTVPAVR